MWPWEHAVLGYVAYSLVCRAIFRDTPRVAGAVVVVFASVLPDLIDKPLAWSVGVFETGYALAHSLFFAVPLAVGVAVVSRWLGRTRLGVAFVVGYLLHPPADVFHHYAEGGGLHPEIMLWPIATYEARTPDDGFVVESANRVLQYGRDLAAGEITTYAWLQFGLFGCAVVLWVADGMPILRETVEWLGRKFSRNRR